jgi:acyl transferase domain-containing protein/acyl-CoA thioesterase FadM
MTDRPPALPIAVIGLACRYPDATTPRQLWENILARRRQFRRLPDCRLPLADYHDADKRAPDKTYGRQAAVIDGFDFDWAGHRIPLSTTRTTDIVHWLALDVSLAAVADAGYTRETLPAQRTGVIIGNTLTGEQTRASTMRLRWPFVRRALHGAAQAQGMDAGQIQRLTRHLKERYKAVFPPVDEDTLAGSLSNTIAGRICNFLNVMGGGFTVDGACASSLLAVAHAASRMAAQELDLAIVGGVDISLDPFELVGFAKTGALTDMDMLVYDRGGKGFIPGEGCGFIVLKPLDAAHRDNNPVYATIHGWGISSDGGGSGITAPSAAGQALALERAYRVAPYDITDLDFIEGHGTGTTVGDRTELEAIARVLGSQPVASGNLRPCGITSLKSIVGHTKAASGIGGLLKAVMAVNRRVIPPTAACREPHQAFDGAARRLYPVRHGRQEATDRSLKAGVSAMGFGGINCHITLVSADPPDNRLAPDLEEGALLACAQESELLALGAATPASMLEKVGTLRRMADGISIAELTDLAADLGRQVPAEAPVRAAIVVGHPDDLPARLESLETALRHPDGQRRSAASPGPDCWLATERADPRIGFLFPGQGAQQLNMAGMLVRRFAWARALVEQADRMTRELNGIAVSELIFRNPDRAPGPEERDRWLATLSQTENAQPAICLASVLWLTYFSRLGVKPVAVGGHSLGELTACFAAGGLDTTTLLGFAAHRGQLMSTQSAAAGAMVSLQCNESRANDLIRVVDGYLTVANLNSPRQTVVSGEAAAAKALADSALKEGISARILKVSGAFHSRLVATAARQVAGLKMLAKPLAPLSCRLFSSTDGTSLEAGLPLNDHFSSQIQSRVDFIRMATNLAACCELIVEQGPGRILTGLVGDLLGDTHAGCLPVESTAGSTLDMNRTIATLFARGVAIRWERLCEKRLTRPFVPAADKAFIVNPCETLPRADGGYPDDDPDMPRDLSRGVLAEAFNGVPEKLVQRYLASRGPFLNQVVQSDLSFWNPDAPALEPGEAADRTAPDRAATADDIQAMLYQLVADTTGFATEMLSGASRLLDDLNLDSIKAGDLIGKFARQCGVTFPDPTLLGNATLGELVDAAHRLQVGPAEPARSTDALTELRQQAQRITGFAGDALDPDLPVERGLKLGPDKLKTLVQRTAAALEIEAHVDLEPLLTRNLRQIGSIMNRMIAQQHARDALGDTDGPVLPAASQAAAWVRNFAMDLVESPFPEFPDTWRMRSENDWQRARVLILHSDDAIDVAEALGQNFFQRGALTQVASFDDETAATATQDPAFSHLVAILPKNGHRDNDRAALLRRMIRMRASVVAVPPAARTPKRRTAVAWIQFGGGFFGREPKFARLDRCAAMALAASVHLERTDLRVRVVDFCPALPPEVIAWETIAEMSTQEDFAAVGYDLDRTRRTLRPQLVRPAAFHRRDIDWSGKDVILVTGGARGITSACALAVARETGACMALVGRTPPPDQAPTNEGSREIEVLLDQYAEKGLRADYFACDIADRDAVAAMIAAVVGRCGPITGLIHGAGLNRPRLTGQVDPQQAFAETAPKLLGLLHILDILAARPPKLIVAIGSIIGISGMPGNGWYGFSNEAMDIALRGFTVDHPQTAAVDVAFSIWGETGMGVRMGNVKLLREKGIDAISTDEGVARFLKLFTHDPTRRQVVVTARMAGLDTWRPAAPEVPRGWRFLEARHHVTPGVEAVFAAHLALETDPYLKDHHFQGSYLFPAVFGLEAMAQAAQYLLGRSDLSRLQIRDVRLDRPITVDPDTGADIVIRAMVAESPDKGETVVQAGIVKTGSGVEADFFRASLVFDPPDGAPEAAVTLPEAPTPLVPHTDLYRPSLLFQGPRFQGIRTVWAIEASDQGSVEALFTSNPSAAEHLSSAAFGEGQTRHLSLGDPFFGDTLLQSAALMVPQDTSLPVAIERMDLFPEFFEATAPATVQVRLVEKTDRNLTVQVVALGQSGAVRAVLSGYRLNILKHHPEYPTVADLVSPEGRDRALIRQALETACRDLSVTAPIVDLTPMVGIHELPKSARHELETPLLERALETAGRRYAEAGSPLRVEWQATGKPGVAGVDQAVLDVALTHEDRTCLCVCAPGPVGCDLAAVTPRSSEQWLGLLGDRRSALLEALVEEGDDPDRAGTRIWAAAETLTKITGQAGGGLDVLHRFGDAVLFQGGTTENRFHILTLPIHLTWGSPQILALSVTPEVVPRVPEHLLTADYPGYEPLYETRSFEMVENGPQGQLVFVQRLPVTFQPSANLSRTIYFANFIKWMGNTREASAWPVLAEMSEQFASGRWGGATNFGHLKILGEGRTSDQVEILMWVSDNSGPHNSTMTLSYDFRQMMPDGGYRRLAYCRLQTTWVEILGPGVARAAPYPAYYGQFIEDMCPRFDAPDTLEPMEATLSHLFEADDDPLVYTAPSGTMLAPSVREQTFETTLAHANLVGNIYYANYYDWQGQIRDRLFYDLIPDYYRGVGEKGELLTLESRVDHLREAMPFDTVVLTLALKELRRCSVTFQVDYFRLEPDGERLKIAYGLHRAVWVRRDPGGRPMAAAFPDQVRRAFDNAIRQAT